MMGGQAKKLSEPRRLDSGDTGGIRDFNWKK